MPSGCVRAAAARLLVALAGLGVAIGPATAQAPGRSPGQNPATSPGTTAVARFTTLDWPPFSAAGLAGGGAFVEILREALAPAGIRVEVEVLPWKRAVDKASRDPAIAGFLPVYLDDLVGGFFPSAQVLASPLGLAERRADSIAWSTLDDLKPLRIGTVLGYTNTPAFDEAVQARRLTIEEAPDDLSNLLKVAAGRLRVAVIDCTVLRFLLDHEARLAAARGAVQCNPRPLALKGIFVALRDDARGHALDGAIRRGLAQVDPEAVMARYREVVATPAQPPAEAARMAVVTPRP